ncbi:hemolysin family protein [Actinomadura kijaniata]|uniref:CBS domain containing-hemolysin-like protein n=1 Tax=Actinomadura namibiensis TaxID=182080 RepID=A0A7W3LL84_ACTNM|nr:hemolysin family protein [Actinomadura namibiensis]MBA8950193.1 CBS domain containing-hemolysin-like protein [Actinomadura namibiensis]
MDPLTSLLITVLLLVGNGFFVAAEFALVAAGRSQLERAAARGSRPAVAAVAGKRELSLMLAGAQFGITMCSLGLAIVTEPAFEHFLEPPLHALGVPETGAKAIALVTALAVITFLHMVVGEMAPKSWAIAHPERSALILALPFRAFAKISRPVLSALNAVTNGLLRLIRVTPRDELDEATDPARLSHLLGESRRLGLIGRHDHELLRRSIAAREATVGPLVVPTAEVTTVPAAATAAEIRRVATSSGHNRLVVLDGSGVPAGIVHVRAAITSDSGARPAAELAHPAPRLTPSTTVLDAVTRLRRSRSQLAVVTGEGGGFAGIVTLDDLLAELLATNPH